MVSRSEGSTPTTRDARWYRPSAAQNMPVPAPTSSQAGTERGANDPTNSAHALSDASGIAFPLW
ncbi:hypothetical protein [Streptomyces buecherae]|uniref:hypothetical protein n=1 Tax=Streptomyces buecherae TaxID=2763006 RepID=UPI0036D1C91D